MIHQKKEYIYIRLAALLLLLGILVGFALTSGTFTLRASAAPDTHKAPYMMSIDHISEQEGCGAQTMVHVCSDYVLKIGGVIELAGWLATDEGVARYECAWLPSGGGVPAWRTPDSVTISSRPDLAPAGIPYRAGHGSAGFALTVKPDEGMTDGYYDLYIRAITGDGVVCDLLILAGMAYGTPDIDDGHVYSFSFPRLAREENALINASLSGTALLLESASMVRLGELNLGAFERITVTYTVNGASASQKQAILGLKSSEEHHYGQMGEAYNITDHLVCLPIDTSQEGIFQTAEIDLTSLGLTYTGPLYLCGYFDGQVTVHSLELTYTGQGFSRTAAKIYFSEDTTTRFAGINKVDFQGVNDPVMGDVLRITVNEDTNDPYATFNAEALLGDYDIRLNADDYKYMVVLARAAAHNQTSHMGFYLCAGTITGATEACTFRTSLHRDGKWHYYLLDLSQTDNWEGLIHNWRFDIINGDCRKGDYVDIATVQLFRTKEAAAQAASVSATARDDPYVKGQPAVLKDMREETEVNDAPYIIPVEDSYVVTESDTLPPEEPTATAEEIISSPAEITQEVSDTSDAFGQAAGCSSALSLAPSVTLLSLVLLPPTVSMVRKRARRRV